MEGYERAKIVPVHVMRQAFHVSGQLSEDIRSIMPSESRSLRIAAFSTNRVPLDRAAYESGEYNELTWKANKRFLAHAGESAIYLSEDVHVVPYPNRGVRLDFFPRTQQSFNELVGSFDILPDVRGPQAPRNHFIQVYVPSLELLREVYLQDGEVIAQELGKRAVDYREGRLRSFKPIDSLDAGYRAEQRVPVSSDQARDDLPQAS